MTETSSRQWDFITQENLSAKEAVAFLRKGMKLRTFRDNLQAVYSGDDLEHRLVKGMYQCALLYDAHPEKLRQDYIRRKVYNWMNNKNLPVNREELFQICFVLELDGIHAEEELISFMLNHSGDLGNASNTAYDYFCKMLFLLSENNNPKDRSVSLESIADDYLRMNMPITKKTAHYNTIQKIIKKYWPGPRTIKAMKNRSEEVSRKVLLLLYIVTGGIRGNEYTELDEEYIDAADFLETHCRQMNHMLTDCGIFGDFLKDFLNCSHPMVEYEEYLEINILLFYYSKGLIRANTRKQRNFWYLQVSGTILSKLKKSPLR